MKKETAKKLTLSKIKIAKLNSMTRQENMDRKPTYTGCSLFKCTPPTMI